MKELDRGIIESEIRRYSSSKTLVAKVIVAALKKVLDESGPEATVKFAIVSLTSMAIVIGAVIKRLENHLPEEKKPKSKYHPE